MHILHSYILCNVNTCSLDANQMLTVNLDTMLVTPDIMSGIIKQIHISVASTPLAPADDPITGYSTINVS